MFSLVVMFFFGKKEKLNTLRYERKSKNNIYNLSQYIIDVEWDLVTKQNLPVTLSNIYHGDLIFTTMT